MKLRNGFVSNSSSSSFIIENKDNFNSVIKLLEKIEGDYYIIDDILYTSCISDCLDSYNEIYDLADYDISTAWNQPYDTEDFYEFEGERGVDSVWIEKFRCKDLQKVEELKSKQLLQYVTQFSELHEINSERDIKYLTLDDINVFINTCLNKSGVYDIDNEYNLEL